MTDTHSDWSPPGGIECSSARSCSLRFAVPRIRTLYRASDSNRLRAFLAAEPQRPIERPVTTMCRRLELLLEHDNQRRGRSLIGHSQGSMVLTELIKNEIDGKPVQSRSSQLVAGNEFAPAAWQDVGGAFPANATVPLCEANRMRHYLRFFPINAPPPP